MRRSARALVTCSPWPGEQASPAEIAQLALLRLLRLQREAHRAASVGATESLFLLARASVETFIAGLYWLESEDAGERLTEANARALKRVLQSFVEALDIPNLTLESAVHLVGQPHQAPDFRRMAEVVDSRSGVDLATHFYDRLYIPLSEMFVHPTGVSMLRHVDPDEHLTDLPAKWWSRRAALHTVDACASHLAWAIAKLSNQSTSPFADYTVAHANRMFPPAITMFVHHALRSIRLTEWPKLVRSRSALRAAATTYGSLHDDAAREAFAREVLGAFFDQFEFARDDELLEQMIDVFARTFL
jgi:hypothetical protein